MFMRIAKAFHERYSVYHNLSPVSSIFLLITFESSEILPKGDIELITLVDSLLFKIGKHEPVGEA